MKIHEYQGKLLFARYGIPVPRGIACSSPDEARHAAAQILHDTGTSTIVLKAQIHAGGRGKAGGVRVITTGVDDVARAADEMLSTTLVTHQTGPEGRRVRCVYVEQGLDIARELYLSVVVDRALGRLVVLASSEGGVDIEEVATRTPEKLFREVLPSVGGLHAYQARRLGFGMQIGDDTPNPKATLQSFLGVVQHLTTLFESEDCSLCEVNPLIITRTGEVVALDAKITFDDNASFRHPEWATLTDTNEEDPVELEAKRAGLSYVSLDGNIGCLVNGAGLAMATMDIIKHWGGSPANFLDVGGGASAEAVTKAFSMIVSSRHVKGIFVNIFGGIMRCDVIAEGIVQATRNLHLRVPLVVRLAGTNVEQGKDILRRSGLKIESADSLGEGAKKIVAAVNSPMRERVEPLGGT